MQPHSTQTPELYPNELNAFPNSIIEVATAIPAFIGYTQQASYKGKDLSNTPVRVESLQDFQTFFGYGFQQQFSLTPGVASSSPLTSDTPATPGAVTLQFVTNKQHYILQPSKSQSDLYYLYNAILLFYVNGGSTCYIVSIGTYDNAPSDKGDFEKAIDQLEFEEDPTMLLCPDALRLPMEHYNEVQQRMLDHCARAQSRVALFDMYHGAITDPRLLNTSSPIDKFRDAIQDNLNFGIAYFPWVKTTVVSDTDVSFLNLDAPSLQLLETLLNPQPSTTYKALTDAADAAAEALSKVQPAASHAKSDADTATASAKKATQDASTATQAVHSAADAWATAIQSAEAAATDQQTAEISAALALAATIASNQAAAAANSLLIIIDDALGPLITQADAAAQLAASTAKTADSLVAATTASDATAAAQTALVEAQQQAIAAAAAAGSAYGKVDSVIAQLVGKQVVTVPGLIVVPGTTVLPVNIFQMAQTLLPPTVPGLSDLIALKAKRQSVHNALKKAFPDYARTIQAIIDFMNILPVAPAMAGVYTAIDGSSGVWKAPTNVGLNAVTKPTLSLNDRLQINLNVDAFTGKSINTVRYFKGKGTQVLGARTLDGNSDKWRYVNVRRTLIMIEQSLKMAIRGYFFEANDANTWATINDIINNFLHILWKQGALCGTVPTEAYTVSVGQGATMTGEDVLNGKMRVLVQVSLVRPAEFISLTFEQQMYCD